MIARKHQLIYQIFIPISLLYRVKLGRYMAKSDLKFGKNFITKTNLGLQEKHLAVKLINNWAIYHVYLDEFVPTANFLLMEIVFLMKPE